MTQPQPNPETVEELLELASDLPYGEAHKLELLERAVALADAQGDLRAGFAAREDLTSAATMGGHPEKTLVAFAWQLAQFDQHGEDVLEADEFHLLWRYKWVINSLWEFPSISRAQIEHAFTDFEARLERAGYSLRTALYFRWKYAFYTGQLEQTERWRTRWIQAEDDPMGDCSACEAHFLTDYRAGLGQFEAALEAAQPILSGRERCAHVPHSTLGSVLEPLVRTGQLEAAMDAHLRGYRMVKTNPSFLSTCGQHLAFLALTHNLEAALNLLEVHLPWALSTADLMGRLAFFRDTLPLWARLREQGQAWVKVHLPPSLGLETRPEGYALEVLEGWFRAQLEDLAGRFDARNGNAHVSSQLGLDRELLERIPALPVRLDSFNTKLNAWKGKGRS